MKPFSTAAMPAKYLFLLVFVLCAVAFTPLCVMAQNEVIREQIALQGLQEFGFTANIEGNRMVTDSEHLTPTIIRQQAINQLVEADIRFVPDEDVQSSADIPFLHMHINTMYLDNGLIPFTVQLRLYQPVKLMLNRDLQTSASTWDAGMVGIVSHDQLPLIQKAASALMDEFIQDYDVVNR